VPGYALHGTSDKTKIALGMGWLWAVDIASWSYRDATTRVKIQLDLGAACGTQPEELRVSSWPFMGIDLACIEELELRAAGWIDAVTDHLEYPVETKV
jgi:hypothetical protein